MEIKIKKKKNIVREKWGNHETMTGTSKKALLGMEEWGKLGYTEILYGDIKERKIKRQNGRENICTLLISFLPYESHLLYSI